MFAIQQIYKSKYINRKEKRLPYHQTMKSCANIFMNKIFSVVLSSGLIFINTCFAGLLENIDQNPDKNTPIKLIAKPIEVYKGDKMLIECSKPDKYAGQRFILQLDGVLCDDPNTEFGKKAFDYTFDKLQRAIRIWISCNGRQENILIGTVNIDIQEKGYMSSDPLVIKFLSNGWARYQKWSNHDYSYLKKLQDEAISKNLGRWGK